VRNNFATNIAQKIVQLSCCCFIISTFLSCADKKKESAYFRSLDSKVTGLDFVNRMKPTPQFNLLSYMYYYNGAGVGAGDFNNDGLIDLFFSANQGDNKLYINKGKLNFKDVTTAAQIPQDSGWSTGVSVVDINNDGMLDIYVCKVGHYKVLHSKNQLLVCKGIGKDGVPFYKDEAQEYGLDFAGFSTQAAFFDYDGDGDLDMFLLNHSVNHDGNYAPRENFINTYDSLAGQKMYRNDIVKNASGRTSSHFTDVTVACGIHGSRIGYGLGVAVADINLDGWPDLYVGNDFHENDYLYINQHNGTFVDETTKRLMHTSQFSMGVDVADINNDAFPEIISMDMLPYDPYMLRRSLAEDDYNIYQQKIKYGYNYQYARNNLQYNRRNSLFSEAGQYTGVNATDWSWAALWMDFDNDGSKDLFVSNGIPKRMNDIDYISYVSNEEVQEQLMQNGVQDKDMALINKFPQIKIPNQFFQNKKDLSFLDISDSIGGNKPTFSNGSVYADLDNDGDLDIVVNNIDDPVLLYENTANNDSSKTFASVQLKGPENNINAIGAKVFLFAGTEIRTYENNAVHGFQSSMLAPLHIGLDRTVIDSVILVWPDNTFQKIELKKNNRITYLFAKGLPAFDYAEITHHYKNLSRVVEDITAETGLNYLHTENPFNEFNREQLQPHMVSTEGPAVAVSDINHDGLEDIFIGASKTYHNAVYLQSSNGKFIQLQQPGMMQDSMWENTSAQWVDVNNDGNVDLVIASGGNEYYGSDIHLLPLLYLNDGKGNLTKKNDAFSDIYMTQSIVAAYDFNSDGFTDLFIGGRVEPWKYGVLPRSYLLQNDGTGKFRDVTPQYAKELLQPGMVTDAKWFDANKDGRLDLLVCYEWGGIDVFMNNKNAFVKTSITEKKGWWNFILPCDIDNDGDMDLIAGNYGLNSRLKASDKEPVSLYYNDFDNNGTKEQVLTYFVKGEEIPFATKQELERQMPFLKKKYLYAADFAKANMDELFTPEKIRQSEKLIADCFANAVFVNNGNMKFEMKPMPYEAQLSAYRDAVVTDANHDNLPDILLMGNYYDSNVEIGRSDADFGMLLINKGEGRFASSTLNGLSITGQVRHIQPLTIGGQHAYLLAKNNDSTRIIKFK
jgi:hypothetical protein